MKTLIRAMYDRGLSNRELEARASNAGHRVKFQTFSELANNAPKSWPKRTETISGLAAALDVTERTIVLAFAESLGVDVGRVGFADLVPRGADVMEPEMREAVLAVIRAATKGAEDEAQEQGPSSRGTSEQQPPPMTEQEALEWAAREAAKADARGAMRRARNNPATPKPARRPSRRAASDGDGTTTHSKGA